ncbi:MAG TPA: ABC transporter substrate-binding protein [Stellaceae bacterium]|nr:ABC transporter substrate-binding protein [Stellaceae bacterium]
MTTRRRFLATTAAGAAVSGFPAILRYARAAEPVTLITPFGYDSDFIDMMNAYSGGHFAKEGLDAKVLGGRGTVQALQAVIADEAQFTRFSGIDFIRAVASKHAPLLAAATLRKNLGFHIISLANKPVRSGADLKGKTVGLLSIGGSTETYIDVLRAQAKIPKSDVKLIVAGNSPGEVELIRKGRIDCFICTFSVTFTVERTIKEPLVYLNVDDLVPAPGQVFIGTRDAIAKKPDLVVKVLRALKSSMEEIMTKPIRPIFERAGKDFEIPGIKDLDTMVALQKESIKVNWLGKYGAKNLLRNEPAQWQAGCDALRSVGIVDVKDPTSLYTNTLVDKV